MEETAPHLSHRNWNRVGGPVASLCAHVVVIGLLVQHVGSTIVTQQDTSTITLNDPQEDLTFDPTPADPPPDPEPYYDMPSAGSEPEGPVIAQTAEPIQGVSADPGPAGPGTTEDPGITLAPGPVSPLLIRGLTEGGGGGGGGGRSFGYRGGMAGDLVGTMYDLKRSADGADREPNYLEDVRHVLAGRLTGTAFADFYRVTNQLYLTQLFVPVMPAEQGPAAFSAGDQVKPRNWLIHYRGTIRAPTAGKYRFVGMFDDLLMVLVDGKIVMEFLWTGDPTPWAPTEFVDQHPCYAGRPLVYGDWVDLDPREAHRIDILVGEHPGGLVGGLLMVQEKGRAYQVTPEGRPILPIFTVQRPTVEERVRMVRFDKWKFDANIPVFSTKPEAKMVEKSDDQLKVEII